jgi:hypothetical protein
MWARIESDHLLTEEAIGAYLDSAPGVYQFLSSTTKRLANNFCLMNTRLNMFKNFLPSTVATVGGLWTKRIFFQRSIRAKLISGRKELIPWTFGLILGPVGLVLLKVEAS